MPRSSLLLALAAALASAAPLTGQTPAQRTLIEAYRDSLQGTADSAGLAGLEGRLIAQARKAKPNPATHLRLGFLALRRAELGTTDHYEDAAAEFQWVTRLAATWPYGWYGLGLAEFGLARTSPRQAARTDAPPPRAVSALVKAVSVDPRFAESLASEAVEAGRTRNAPTALLFLEALRSAGRVRGPNPAVLAALGRSERALGDVHSALRAFEAWLPGAGPARGIALLEVARTRFLLGRSDGIDPYYQGAVVDDTTSVREYRSDIAMIALESELRAYDRASGPARADVLRRFWRIRDAADLRREGDRLREHYRRLFHARRTYPIRTPAPDRSLADQIALGNLDVDDRGLIYIRHGEPDDRVSLNARGLEPNESWRYGRDEGDLVLHFVARNDPDQYRLVESLFDVGQVLKPDPSVGTSATPQGEEALLRSREPLSGFYQRRRPGRDDNSRSFQLSERAMSRASLVAATTSDSYRQRFRRSLAVRIDAVTFDQPGGARLDIGYAIPYDSLGAAWIGAGMEYPLKVQFAAYDLDGNVVAGIDSTYRPVTWESDGTRWLAGQVRATLPVGRFRMRLLVAGDDSTGSLSPIRSLEVQPASTRGIALGELAVGDPRSPWQAGDTGGESTPLNPLGSLRRDGKADLSFTLGADRDTRLTAQVTVIRVDERAGIAANDRFAEAAGPSVHTVRRPIDLRKLKPGLYRVEVTVSDGRGGLARRWKEFEVQEPARPDRK